MLGLREYPESLIRAPKRQDNGRRLEWRVPAGDAGHARSVRHISIS